jgi:hypothetical protein
VILPKIINYTYYVKQDIDEYIHIYRLGQAKKLDSQMEGPYRILEKVGNAYRLDLPPGIKVHPVIATSRLRKTAEDPVPGQHPDPPTPD